jgi:CheY-like chemotaxis protein
MAETQFAILCVDDEPAVLHPLEIMLKRRGFHVVTAPDGPAAIELFRQIKFHAVILDYSMPGMSGGEVAQVLRQESKTVPIILHTGYKELDDPLLENVTCTLPKGSLSFLVTKLNDLLQPETTSIAEEAQPESAPEAPATHSAHVA